MRYCQFCGTVTELDGCCHVATIYVEAGRVSVSLLQEGLATRARYTNQQTERDEIGELSDYEKAQLKSGNGELVHLQPAPSDAITTQNEIWMRFALQTMASKPSSNNLQICQFADVMLKHYVERFIPSVKVKQ